ncbi:MAG TPA: hypothetical protein VFM34_06910, partial [Moraxellaceae bacterium]|nr:hypothetical protein [Moraxellaceae bacterium]
AMTRAMAWPRARRLAWELRRSWEAAGFLEMLAVALLALWLGLETWVNAPLRALVAAEAQREAGLSAQAAQLARPATAPQPLAAPADAVRKGFPPASQREAQIRRLHALAADAGVTLERIDYQLAPLKALPLQKLTLRLSGVAPYEAHRRFLHDLLRTFGNAGIERVGIEKEKDSVQNLRLSLDVALYFRGQP